MMKQKYGNGYWIGKTIGVCPQCFSIYHYVPGAFVLGILFTTLLAALGYPFLSEAMWIAYLLLMLLFTGSAIAGEKEFSPIYLVLPLVFLALHISYGIGTLVGLIEMPFWVKSLKKTE
jgi:hypothetical protein